MGRTRSFLPSPMALLTRVLQVDAKAISTIHISPEMLLMMLETASGLSPVCSMKRKKMNQVEIERKFCIMVQPETENIDFIVSHDKLAALFKAYFSVSQDFEV